jgi:zinc protease
MIAWHAPGLSDADFAALEVADAILAQGRSARLLQSLVFRQGLATSVTASYDGINIDPRIFLLYAQVFPGKQTAAVEKALLEEIDRLRNQPVTEAELEKAKTQIEANWYRAQDSAFYRGMQVGQYAIVGDWRKIDEYLPAIRKVRAADVQRAARRIFTEDNRTTALLVPTRPRNAPSATPGHGGIR